MNILTGVTVLDVTNVLAGPFAGYLLALLGAETIKIEHPKGGDLARKLGISPELNKTSMGTSFLAQNANKKSIGINLKMPEGKKIFKKMVKKADVVLENFRPDVMDKLGLGYKVLKEIKEDLIYCGISGFGRSGPLAKNPAYDQIIQGKSGLMDITGTPESGPLRVGAPITDTVGGLTAVMSILGALYFRSKTEKGQMVDVALLDAILPMMGWSLSNYLIAGEKPVRMGNDNFTAAPSGAFQAKDGLLNISANKDEQWQELCKILDLEELITDPRFAERDTRKKNRYELTRILNERLKVKTAAEWEKILNAHGIPSGTVNTLENAIHQPQVQHRKLLKEVQDEKLMNITVCGLAPKFSAISPQDLSFPPRLGEHTEEIMKRLSYEEETIAEYREKGVIA